MSDVLNMLGDLDLNTVQTAMPILSPQTLLVKIAEITVTPNKAGTGNLMNFKFTLVNETVDETGKPVNPSFPLFDRISLVRTYQPDGTTLKYDPLPKLARFREAVTGTKEGSFMPTEQYIGQEVAVRIKIEDSADFGRKNTIDKYIKAT